jgi:hypothetical protein
MAQNDFLQRIKNEIRKKDKNSIDVEQFLDASFSCRAVWDWEIRSVCFANSRSPQQCFALAAASHTFFQVTIFQPQVGDDLFQRAGLTPQLQAHFFQVMAETLRERLTQLRGFQNKYSCTSMACEPSDVLGTTRSGWFGRGRDLLEDGWQRDAEGAA